MNFPIGVIGGTGGMGKWMVRFLENEGFRVEVRGRNRGTDLAKMAAACPVIVVAVPMGTTVSVIGDVGPLMREDGLLMDLTSLKKAPVEAMLRASPSEVIGCHPLFGPNISSVRGENIVLCPARGDRWFPWVRDLFEKKGARIVETTPEYHDRMMAAVQAMTHLNTVLFGLYLRDSGIPPGDLQAFSTPVFRAKRALVERIASSPLLYAGILSMNPHRTDVLKRYRNVLKELEELLETPDGTTLADALSKLGSGSGD
jgi:prephenate dehydrogenase